MELWSRAAELGSADGHHSVGCVYNDGEVVETDSVRAVSLAAGSHAVKLYGQAQSWVY